METSAGPSETELRHRLYELDLAMDEARQQRDQAGRLAELADDRDTVKAALQALLPLEAEVGFQRNADEDFHKAAFVDTPIFIQGDQSEHG